jgi:putative ABC transport system permease protein
MIRRLAWYQLVNERLRLLAAVAGITFAVLLQLMQFGFRDSLYTSSTLVQARLRADLVMTSAQYMYLIMPGSFARRRLYEALRVKDVASVASVSLGLTPFKDPTSREERQGLMLAFNPDEDVFDLAAMNVTADELERIRVPDVVLFDRRSREELRPLATRLERESPLATESAGHRLEFGGLFDLGVSFTGQAHLLASDETLRRTLRRPEGTIEIGLLRLKPGANADAVLAALAAVLPPDVRVMTRQQFVALEQAYWDRATPIGFIFLLGTFVGLLVGAVIVYQILYTDVTDHLPEYATLKAMGYRDSALSLVVIQEAIILSILGFPVGFALALLLYKVARDVTGLPIVMTGSRVALVLTLTLGMCGFAGLLAMRKLRSADPADAF